MVEYCAKGKGQVGFDWPQTLEYAAWAIRIWGGKVPSHSNNIGRIRITLDYIPTENYSP